MNENSQKSIYLGNNIFPQTVQLVLYEYDQLGIIWIWKKTVIFFVKTSFLIIITIKTPTLEV
jgi:hypothetical protein